MKPQPKELGDVLELMGLGEKGGHCTQGAERLCSLKIHPSQHRHGSGEGRDQAPGGTVVPKQGRKEGRS